MDGRIETKTLVLYLRTFYAAGFLVSIYMTNGIRH